MTKILIFTDWYLPGFKAGGPIQSMANLVSNLSETFSFYIVCRNSDYLESLPYQGIVSDVWTDLSENEHVYYISKEKLTTSTIKAIIQTAECETIYINGIYSLYFSVLPLLYANRHSRAKIIVAPRGMLSNQAFSSKKLKKSLFSFAARIFGLYRNISFHATSDAECMDIQKHDLAHKGLHVLPNLTPKHEFKKQIRVIKQVGDLKLISVARISPEKNTLFAIECLGCSTFNGNISLHLYGSVYDKAYWKQCLQAISGLPANVEVVYMGELNHDLVFDTLSAYHFLFLPSCGENFGHSILEAFLAGRPAIISNKTPWQNLEKQQLGWDLELNQNAFAEILQKALDLNLENYQVLANSCLDFARILTDNQQLTEAYKNFLQ